VEYLFVVVFLVGFIVAVMVPTLQQGEISYALAGARTKAIEYEAAHPQLRLTVLNYTVEGDRILLDPRVYNRSSGRSMKAPAEMKVVMLQGIHALAPSLGVDGQCANTSNYEYCMVS